MGNVTFDFSDEVVVVTGGSRGLGFEIAQAFGTAGATVVITARREQWLHEAEQQLQTQGIKVFAVKCDVADASAVESAVQQTLATCGDIDVLVNNAGLTWGTPAQDMPLERWRQVLDANITGTFLMSQAIGRHMLERNKGVIVNIASIAGLSGGQLNTVGYNASKAAVINMTRALAIEWATHNIRVNAIAPGLTDTQIARDVVSGKERAYEEMAKHVPIGRAARPEEMASAVLWLCSPGASYVVGHALTVDGGLTVA